MLSAKISMIEKTEQKYPGTYRGEEILMTKLRSDKIRKKYTRTNPKKNTKVISLKK